MTIRSLPMTVIAVLAGLARSSEAQEATESPTTEVHVVGEAPATLETMQPDSHGRTLVCHAPCVARVPHDAGYLLTGEGLEPSHAVYLQGTGSETLTMDVHPVAKEQHDAKPFLIVTGSLMAVGGFATWFVEGANWAFDVDPGAGPAAWAGLGVAVVGGVMILVGAVLKGRTTVTQSVAISVPGVAPARLATWTHLDTFEARLPTPRTSPLFSVSL